MQNLDKISGKFRTAYLHGWSECYCFSKWLWYVMILHIIIKTTIFLCGVWDLDIIIIKSNLNLLAFKVNNQLCWSKQEMSVRKVGKKLVSVKA